MERRLNYVAIVVAGIVYWLIQAVWYTLLSNQWANAIGKSKSDMQGGSAIPFVGALICDIIVAWALAWVLTRSGRTTAFAGAITGAALSIGFVATLLLTNYLFEQAPRMLFYINAGCPLVGMTVAGAIVGAWQKKNAGVLRSASAR